MRWKEEVHLIERRFFNISDLFALLGGYVVSIMGIFGFFAQATNGQGIEMQLQEKMYQPKRRNKKSR